MRVLFEEVPIAAFRSSRIRAAYDSYVIRFSAVRAYYRTLIKKVKSFSPRFRKKKNFTVKSGTRKCKLAALSLTLTGIEHAHTATFAGCSPGMLGRLAQGQNLIVQQIRVLLVANIAAYFADVSAAQSVDGGRRKTATTSSTGTTNS